MVGFPISDRNRQKIKALSRKVTLRPGCTSPQDRATLFWADMGISFDLCWQAECEPLPAYPELIGFVLFTVNSWLVPSGLPPWF